MVILRKIKATSLTETVIAMTLSLFLFGFIAWFLANTSQNRFSNKNTTIYTALINSSINNDDSNQDVQNTYQILNSSDYLNADNRLIEKRINVCNKSGKTIYQCKIWLINPQGENEIYENPN